MFLRLLLLLAPLPCPSTEPAAVPGVGEAGPVDPAKAADDARSEVERYRRQAGKLRGFRDGGKLEERDVLRALERSGVLQGLGQPFRPFRVPVFRDKWDWPLRAGVVSSEFGPRWGRRHDGIDLAADPGVPVRACAPGEVLYAGDGLRGYGNVVILRHDQHTTSLYAHNQSLKVRAGDWAGRGRVIALLGSTGRSTGPHVHFEIRVKRKAVDPRALLPKKNPYIR